MLKKKSVVLRASLAARSSGSEAGAAPSTAKSPHPVAKEERPFAWKKLSVEITEMEKAGDIQGIFRLQGKILAMSQEELVSAFDETATLDLPDKSRERLQRLLFHQVSQKDPELALRHCFVQIEGADGSMQFQFGRAMLSWADKNSAAATAWFDQQIAAGKFDSKSLVSCNL